MKNSLINLFHNRHRRHAVISIAGIVAIIFSMTAVSAATSKPATVVPFTFGIQNFSGAWGPFYFMQANPGICTKFGIKLTIDDLNTVSGPPALLSGQVPMQVESGGTFLAQVSANPSSVTSVGGVGPVGAIFFGAANIHSIADLAGKTVGVTSPGTSGDAESRYILEKFGLTPGTNVTISYVGSTTAEIGLTLSGQLSAFAQTPPLPEAAIAAGIHRIYDPRSLAAVVPYQAVPLVVDTSYLASNSAGVKGFLNCLGYTEGRVRLPSNRSSEVSAIETITGENSAESLNNYEQNRPTYNLFPYTTAMAEASIQAYAAVNSGKNLYPNFSPIAINTTLLKGVKGALPKVPTKI